jgi:hypothetical protein
VAQLTDADFLFFVADAAAEGVQYGHKDVLCAAVMGGGGLPGFVNYTLAYWEAVMGNDAADYDAAVLADPTQGGDGEGGGGGGRGTGGGVPLPAIHVRSPARPLTLIARVPSLTSTGCLMALAVHTRGVLNRALGVVQQ